MENPSGDSYIEFIFEKPIDDKLFESLSVHIESLLNNTGENFLVLGDLYFLIYCVPSIAMTHSILSLFPRILSDMNPEIKFHSGNSCGSLQILKVMRIRCNKCKAKIENKVKECFPYVDEINTDIPTQTVTILSESKIPKDELIICFKEIDISILNENPYLSFLSLPVTQPSPVVSELVLLDETDSEKLPLKQFSETIEFSTVRLVINGISCSSCVSSIESNLLKLKGVSGVSVGVLTGLAEIKYCPELVTIGEIIAAIEKLKFSATVSSSTDDDFSWGYFYVDEPRKALDGIYLNEIHGIFDVNYRDEKTGTIIEIKYDKRIIGIRDVYHHLQRFELPVTPIDGPNEIADQHLADIRKWRRIFITSAFFGIISMGIMIFQMVQPKEESHLIWYGLSYTNAVLLVFSTIVQVCVGYYFYNSAVRSLFVFPNMDCLISTAALISYVYSLMILFLFMSQHKTISPHTFFETPIMLFMIVAMGRWIEFYGNRKTTEEIRSLASAGVQVVELLQPLDGSSKNFESKFISSRLLQRGDHINIRTGSRIPGDGIVVLVNGEGHVDESILTGENMGIVKVPGSKVLGGSVNLGVNMVVKLTHTNEECTIQRIAQMVRKAQSNKAPIQNLAQRLSGYFVPLIISLSIVTFLSWITIFYVAPNVIHKLKVESPIQYSIMAAISVLCVACPCAIGLAVPMAIMVGTGVGAKNGILIKGGEPLQNLWRVDKIAFDKTGTLTEGRHSIIKFSMLNNGVFNFLNLNLKAIIMWNVEKATTHPIATSLCNYLKEVYHVETDLGLTGVKTFPGKGCQVVISDMQSLISQLSVSQNDVISSFHTNIKNLTVCIGNLSFLSENNVFVPQDLVKETSDLQNSGHTVVFCSFNSELQGWFVLRDKIRKEAKKVIQLLESLKIGVAMISGDNFQTAHFVGKELGIIEVYAQKLPQQKVEIIQQLQNKGNVVAMVGDGVNDSIALGVATVGIAMGCGADLAADSASVLLVNNNLLDVVNCIDLSRVTMRRIHANLTLSCIYNLISVPIAAGSLKWVGVDVKPWIAAIAMVVSSVSVTISSLWLRRYRKKY